jgi:hypothetical protein
MGDGFGLSAFSIRFTRRCKARRLMRSASHPLEQRPVGRCRLHEPREAPPRATYRAPERSLAGPGTGKNRRRPPVDGHSDFSGKTKRSRSRARRRAALPCPVAFARAEVLVWCQMVARRNRRSAQVFPGRESGAHAPAEQFHPPAKIAFSSLQPSEMLDTPATGTCGMSRLHHRTFRKAMFMITAIRPLLAAAVAGAALSLTAGSASAQQRLIDCQDRVNASRPECQGRGKGSFVAPGTRNTITPNARTRGTTATGSTYRRPSYRRYYGQ